MDVGTRFVNCSAAEWIDENNFSVRIPSVADINKT
jgi:hypothetical protein